MNAEHGGFRGYISTRPVRDTTFPQRVQNVIVRTYAARHDLPYKLSLAEYAMPGCFMMMETLLNELPKLDGIIVFSMFMLPSRRRERARMYARVLENSSHLHAALEETAIRSWADVPLFEDTIQIANALRIAPLNGRFLKTGQPYPPGDRFASQLMRALPPSSARH
jgi:sporadic carbohydrate cluster protein (TIGR04323 family)